MYLECVSVLDTQTYQIPPLIQQPKSQNVGVIMDWMHSWQHTCQFSSHQLNLSNYFIIGREYDHAQSSDFNMKSVIRKCTSCMLYICHHHQQSVVTTWCSGVDRIFLYDHNSSVPLAEELEDLIEMGLVVVERFTGHHKRFKGAASGDFHGTAQVLLLYT